MPRKINDICVHKCLTICINLKMQKLNFKKKGIKKMNNEKKEFFTNDVEVDVAEKETGHVPPIEVGEDICESIPEHVHKQMGNGM